MNQDTHSGVAGSAASLEVAAELRLRDKRTGQLANLAGLAQFAQPALQRLDLPSIVTPVLIDGYWQPGSSANTLATGWNATILIELDGTGTVVADGLAIVTTGAVVRGLAIFGFGNSGVGNGIRLGSGTLQGSSNGNTIAGNIIGMRADGTTIAANTGYAIAVSALGNVDSNTIGGAAPADRNILSGNAQSGVLLNSPGTGNVIRNNYIGTNAAGTAARANQFTGNRIGANVADAALARQPTTHLNSRPASR